MPGWYLRHFGWVPKPVRQIIIGVIGGTLLLLGFVGMMVPIMPGFIFIPVALAILAVEFAWATRWLVKIKRTARSTHNRMKVGWNLRWSEAKPQTSQSRPNASPTDVPHRRSQSPREKSA